MRRERGRGRVDLGAVGVKALGFDRDGDDARVARASGACACVMVRLTCCVLLCIVSRA